MGLREWLIFIGHSPIEFAVIVVKFTSHVVLAIGIANELPMLRITYMDGEISQVVRVRVFQFYHGSPMVHEMRRKPKPSHLPTQGIFNLPHHIGTI